MCFVILGHSLHLANQSCKKEKWQRDATVKDRCEPCHIVHVLQVLSGARGPESSPDAIAAAAFANSLGMFWPVER